MADGQPYCLEALQLVSSLTSDRDTALFPCLLSGVPTGFDADIPLSNVLVPQGSGHPFAQEIAICHGNWSSAEADPETLRALVEEELAQGWLFEMDSLASAQARFGSKLAIGKMSIVSAPGKKPRLVVDSTVCGTNPSCLIPETFALPSVDDVRECFPLRTHAGKLAGFALDVKSAADQGLLGGTLRASAAPRPGTPFRASGVRRALGPLGRSLARVYSPHWGSSVCQGHRFAGTNAEEMVEESIVP